MIRLLSEVPERQRATRERLAPLGGAAWLSYMLDGGGCAGAVYWDRRLYLPCKNRPQPGKDVCASHDAARLAKRRYARSTTYSTTALRAEARARRERFDARQRARMLAACAAILSEMRHSRRRSLYP